MILCSDLYRELAADVQITFVGLTNDEPEWDHGFKDIVECKVEKASYGPQYENYVAELTEVIQDVLHRKRPSILHAQHLGFGLSVAFCRAKRSQPLISFAHGTDVIEASASAQALAVLCEVVSHSLEVICPTQSLLEEVQSLTDNRWNDRLQVIPWGIPLERVSSQHKPSNSPILNLLYAGRLDSNKSVVTAIDALPLTRLPHHLTIIGQGDQLLELRQQSARLGLTQRVEFQPFLDRAELWRRFQHFDALLFTTGGLEAFGLVGIEAQAHGVPVIYSDVGGLRETIGSSGLSYAPCDARELAQLIDLISSDTSLRVKLHNESLLNARKYDSHVTAQKVLEHSLRVTRSDVACPKGQ